MDARKIIDSVVINLQNIDLDNKDVTLKQLASAMDLLDVVAMVIYGNGSKELTCSHPDDGRISLNVMGSTDVRFQCKKCNQIITIKDE